CDQVVCAIQNTSPRRSGSGGTRSRSNTKAVTLTTPELLLEFAPSAYSVGDQHRPRRLSASTSNLVSSLTSSWSPSTRACGCHKYRRMRGGACSRCRRSSRSPCAVRGGSGGMSGHLMAGGQPYPRHLPQGRVRLPGCDRVNANTDASPLGRTLQRRGPGFLLRA